MLTKGFPYYLGRSWTEVDLDAVNRNYRQLRDSLPSNTKIMAVLKGNAYGLGDIGIARYLEKYADDWLAVANLDEAVGLRTGGIRKNILILGYTAPRFGGILAEKGIHQTVLSLEYARALQQYVPAGKQVDVHIKLDTGLGRIGLLCYGENFEQGLQDYAEICGFNGLHVTGTFTHMAAAYNHGEKTLEDLTELQYERFVAFTAEAEHRGLPTGLRHCMNSPGAINHPEMALDMVRVGTAILGGLVEDYRHRHYPMADTLSVKTVVSCVRSFRKGQRFGYGDAPLVEKDVKVATIPVGYTDIAGISEKFFVLIGGKRCPILGEACMDQTMIDVTDLPAVKMGDEVVILGAQSGAVITLEDFAASLALDPNEAICFLRKRLPQIYVSGGKMIASTNYISNYTKF